MKDIKIFCKEHKQKIIFVSCIVGAAVTGAIIHALISKDKLVNEFAGKSVISWVENGGFINLEEVKEILDLNANNKESFAIFREGLNSDTYSCILISDNVITDKPEKA